MSTRNKEKLSVVDWAPDNSSFAQPFKNKTKKSQIFVTFGCLIL
jgi:hypothetical protein